MARVEIPLVVQDEDGNVLAGLSAQVNHRNHPTLSGPATIYQYETGPGTLTNPLSTTAEGRINGWVEEGDYDITISGGSISTFTQPWAAIAGAQFATANVLIKGNAQVGNVGPSSEAGLKLGSSVLYLNGADFKTTSAIDAGSLKISGTALAASHLSNGATGSGSVALAGSPALSGIPTAPTAAADTNTTQLATTAFVIGQAGTSTPNMDGVGAAGSSAKYSRSDHVHPTDTAKANLNGATFTGAIKAPGVTSQDSTSGQVVVGDSSSTARILFGAVSGQVNLYRNADDSLKTDDAFVVGGVLTVLGASGTINGINVVVTNDSRLSVQAAGTPSIRAIGTSSTTACAGDDARLSNSRTPSGSASGDLGGSYPSPTVVKASGAGKSAFSIPSEVTDTGITFGDDAFLYRPAGQSNTLKTDGAFIVSGALHHVGSTLGFYNLLSPVTKPGATSDIKDSLVSVGLITDGGATPLNLDGGALTTTGTAALGSTSVTGTLGVSSTATMAAINASGVLSLSYAGTALSLGGSSNASIGGSLGVTGTTTVGVLNTNSTVTINSGLTVSAGTISLQAPNGTVRIGNVTGGLLGFFDGGPVSKRTGWGSFVTSDGDTWDVGNALRSLSSSYTMDQLVQVVATLVYDLKQYGLLGP